MKPLFMTPGTSCQIRTLLASPVRSAAVFLILLCISLPLSACSLGRDQARSAHPILDGVNVDICLLDPTSKDYVRNSQGQDLIDIAGRLGINLFRITDGGCFHSRAGNARTNNWKMVLEKMAAENIKAIVTTEPPTNGEELTPASVQYITSLVLEKQLGVYPNVYGIDIINEPTLDDNNITLIKQAIHQIKAVYPDLPLSVGGWRTRPGSGSCPATIAGYCWNNPQDGKVFQGLVDYYSAHIYGYDRPLNGPYPDPFKHTLKFLDAMLPFTQGKPVIIEEYGAANGVSVSDQQGIGTPQLQANVTDGVLRAVRAYYSKNVIGSAQWAFYNRSYQTGTSGWEILLDKGDTILPAGYVIQKYQKGKADIPVNVPMSVTNKVYLFRNADHDRTITLRQNDIAGFLLILDSKKNYSLMLGNASLFLQSEPFTYQATHHYYTFVLHAQALGETIITVKQNNCMENCSVFQLKLSIL